MAITSLKPNVTRGQAVACFQGGLGGLARRMAGRGLRSLADVYVPFRLYEVVVRGGPGAQRSLFALDAVDGSLDLYAFARVPEETELVEVETRNHPLPALADGEAERLLRDKVRRLVFQRSFFRVRELSLEARRLPLELHVPYWIGFFERRDSARLSVLDAVRRRFEGAKARTLFEHWLAT